VSSQNPTLQELWAKVMLIERELLEKERSLTRVDTNLFEINKSIDKIKDDLRNQRNIPDIEERLNYLEEQVDAIRLELPEIRLIKKLFLGLIAFVLTGFMGLIWNTVVMKSTENTSMRMHSESSSSGENLNDIAKKFVDEYKKGNTK
jgi:hypothetical protein